MIETIYNGLGARFEITRDEEGDMPSVHDILYRVAMMQEHGYTLERNSDNQIIFELEPNQAVRKAGDLLEIKVTEREVNFICQRAIFIIGYTMNSNFSMNFKVRVIEHKGEGTSDCKLTGFVEDCGHIFAMIGNKDNDKYETIRVTSFYDSTETEDEDNIGICDKVKAYSTQGDTDKNSETRLIKLLRTTYKC